MTSGSPLSERAPRIDALTGLRWWAAFFVFTYHMEVFAPLPGVTAALLGMGYMGVTFFFVLSGFVLTWSASDRVSQSTFYWRRFARIWPAHMGALLFAIPVFYAVGLAGDPAWVKPLEPGILLLSVVLLQGWTLAPSILFSGNPAAWTLTCEMFFYALHPYVSKVLHPLGRRGALIFAGGTIVVAFVYRAIALQLPGTFIADLPVPVIHLPEFVLGMGIAWAIRRGWRPRIPVWIGLGAIAATVLLLVVLIRYFPDSPLYPVTGFANELMTVACALAITAIAGRALAGRRSVFASRVQVKLGEWSFTFYLVHATFIYIALRLFGPQTASWSNLGWTVALFVVALAGAALLHQGVERPVERRLRQWKDRRALARATAA